MASIMPKSRFIHLPKTGGCWVEHALHFCVKGARSINNPHPHLHPDKMPGKHLFTFGFVRHPYEWYRSYWAYRMTKGWDAGNGLDRACGDSVFEHFIENVVEKNPGYFSRVCRNYLGPPGEPIDFIGKQENLVDDLIEALTLAGEDFNADDIRVRQPVNVSASSHKINAVCNDALRDSLLDAEKEVMERFGYE